MRSPGAVQGCRCIARTARVCGHVGPIHGSTGKQTIRQTLRRGVGEKLQVSRTAKEVQLVGDLTAGLGLDQAVWAMFLTTFLSMTRG
ncbi:hypothetical protein PoB_005727700 [Plakobranchus ocellatus]|uniref:Uncharacterized protein n=1 Tax=Plakobranchus ocellatus TaxID=259542 RepID=A0AAV4CH81_9GAST|nr:hypothetical protein PoB_005727700 [Plakobranchus ocellatus]